MAFRYSLFISYRRNKHEKHFIIQLKNKLESIASMVIPCEEVFFDEKSIKWGEEFDEKIYNSMLQSHFFVPIWQPTYLNENKIWCAYELYYAIEIEKVIKEETKNPTFCYILPLVLCRPEPNPSQGVYESLHEGIAKKNYIEINDYIEGIKCKSRNKNFISFEKKILSALSQRSAIEDMNIEELHSRIERPSRETIIEWIKTHNRKIRGIDSKKYNGLQASDDFNNNGI